MIAVKIVPTIIAVIGLFNFDLVAMIFGTMSVISRIIYTLVGIAGLWSIRFFAKVED